MTDADDARTRARVRHHREMLLAMILVVVLSFVLKVHADERVAVGGLPSLALPPLCPAYAWFGLKCPGCGLTRSFVYLAHGDWSSAWRMHRLGWLLAAAVLLQIPYRLLAMRQPDRPPLGTVLPTLFSWTLIVLLFANWLAGLLFPSL